MTEPQTEADTREIAQMAAVRSRRQFVAVSLSFQK